MYSLLWRVWLPSTKVGYWILIFGNYKAALTEYFGSQVFHEQIWRGIYSGTWYTVKPINWLNIRTGMAILIHLRRRRRIKKNKKEEEEEELEDGDEEKEKEEEHEVEQEQEE